MKYTGGVGSRSFDSTVVGGLVTLSADATNTGNAGNVVIWSDGDTMFGGEINARHWEKWDAVVLWKCQVSGIFIMTERSTRRR